MFSKCLWLFSGCDQILSPQPPTISPPGTEPTLYPDDPLRSNMTENFRSYMDHLSHLTPDTADHITGLSRDGEARWGDSIVDMCSDESDEEECPLDHYADRETRNSASQMQRNPNFPYESLATPRVAWGERPREAWNDELRDPHRMFDQTNPYALFNLPRPGLRGAGGFHHHRRSQPGRQEPAHRHRETTHSCREPGHRDINRQDVIRRKHGGHCQNGSHCHLRHDNSRLCQSHFGLAENQTGCEQLQTSQPHLECEENRSSPTDESLRPRLSQSASQEVNDRFIPPTQLGIVPNDPAVLSNNLDRDSLLELRNRSLQAYRGRNGPELRRFFQPTESSNMLEPNPLPTFSSQESMDTSDSSEDYSDVDILTVPHVHCAEEGNGHTCTGHDHSQANLVRDRKSRIVRPKAVKLENGARQRLDRAISESDDEIIQPCPHSSVDSAIPNSSNVTSQETRNTCISPNLGIPLPGLSPSDNDYHSSESRIRHMDTNQNCIAQPPICHFMANSNKKGQKDKHNSVIRKASHQPRPSTATSSIDLTTSESEGGASGYHGDDRERASSPVVQDVNLASGSDDSDIEVVKIESSR